MLLYWDLHYALRLFAKTIPVVNNKIHLVVTKDLEVWLYNSTETDVTLHHGELFGFGQGLAAEAATGWLLKHVNGRVLLRC